MEATAFRRGLALPRLGEEPRACTLGVAVKKRRCTAGILWSSSTTANGFPRRPAVRWASSHTMTVQAAALNARWASTRTAADW